MSANKEGEMPSWPIPSHWNSSQAISKEGVVLYGMLFSPPCWKIRTVLKHYGIKFTEVATTTKEKSDYKKIPVLTIGDKQINDSFIIIQILSQILENSPMSEREKEIEKMNTQGLMLALEVAVMENSTSLRQCAPKLTLNTCLQGVIWTFACCVPCCGLSSIIKSRYPDLKSISAYGHLFAKELVNNPFFHGDQFGVIDCAIFGTLEPFANADNQVFHDFINTDERLKKWWDVCKVQIDTNKNSGVNKL